MHIYLIHLSIYLRYIYATLTHHASSERASKPSFNMHAQIHIFERAQNMAWH